MKKVLVIDNEPDIVKVVKFLLIKMGYSVFVAVDGREGLQKAADIKPDLVLLDYSMPFLNGDEVCKHIKAEEATKHIPVILMTADLQQIQEEQLRAMGAEDMLLKPFESKEFCAKVRKYTG